MMLGSERVKIAVTMKDIHCGKEGKVKHYRRSKLEILISLFYLCSCTCTIRYFIVIRKSGRKSESERKGLPLLLENNPNLGIK